MLNIYNALSSYAILDTLSARDFKNVLKFYLEMIRQTK